jgi:malic enzyme
MAGHTKHPLILPLTDEEPEAVAHSIYAWTEGRALVATAEQQPGPVALPGGRTAEPSMCATHYIFPGEFVPCLDRQFGHRGDRWFR